MATGDLTSDILHALAESEPILSSEAFPNIKSTEVKSALDRLSSRSYIKYETLDREEWILEPEAEQIEANGSHEARVFEALRGAMDGLTIADLEKTIGDKNVTKLGQGKAFREKWISKRPDGKLVAAVRSLQFTSLHRNVTLQAEANSLRRQSRSRMSRGSN